MSEAEVLEMPNATDETDGEDIPSAELEQRVIFALLQPAISLAAGFGVSMRDLVAWVQVAYLKHLRSRGLTLREAAETMGVSERTAKRLSQSLKVSFLRPEFEHNLPVKIEFMLRATPMSAARLAQVIRDVPTEQIESALNTMTAEGRIEPQPGRTETFTVIRSVNSVVRDTWLARIGALNSLAANLVDTVRGRFFARDRLSFARTLTFRVRPSAFRELESAFQELVARVAQLDGDDGHDPQALPIRLSVLFAPFSLPESDDNPE